MRDRDLEHEIGRLAAAGIDRLHWDVIDGEFAPGTGFTADFAAGLTAEFGLSAEAHLMVKDPLSELDAWTDFCDLIVVHVEVGPAAHPAWERIRRRGSSAGIGVNPGTPAAAVPDDTAPVLAMTVEPGHGGAAFRDDVIPKLEEVPRRPLLGVDGGVTLEHVARLRSAGVTWVVSGSDLARADEPESWLSTAREAGPLVVNRDVTEPG